MVESVLENSLKDSRGQPESKHLHNQGCDEHVDGCSTPTTRFLASFPHLSSSSSPRVYRHSLSALLFILLSAMASWDSFASNEPSNFRFSDSWLSDAYGLANEGLAVALQNSLPAANSPSETNNSPVLDFMKPETAALKLQQSAPAGRVFKRKSRALKWTQTTFIAADPEQFRKMVQQVTGVRIGDSPVTSTAALTSEPLRLDSRLTGGGCLPTLDTSALLLNNHQNRMTESTGAASGNAGASPLSFSADVSAVRMDLSSFPTLESWKVK